MLDKKPFIFVCVPTLGSIRVELTRILLNWAKSNTHNILVYFPTGMLPLDNARNHCVSKFIELSNHDDDRLLFIDDDIVPPFNGLDIMLNHDKDIVGLLCFMIKEDDKGRLAPLPIAMRYNNEKKYVVYFEGNGLTEVDALGGGCIMIKRKVFETIGNRCYKFHYYPDGTLCLVGDYSFCQLAQENGFKIYVDFNNICGHMKVVNLMDINNLMVSVKNG